MGLLVRLFKRTLLAAEQDREQQDLLAEALNMLFERYGKVTRAEPLGTRRRR